MRKVVRAAVAVAALVVGFAGSAYAQTDGGPGASECAPPANRPANQYPPSACALESNRSQAAPGDRVTLRGSGYRGNGNVDLVLNSTPMSLGSATTNANGSFTQVVTIPSSAPVGDHTITASGVDASGGQRVLSTRITIVAAGSERGRAAEAATLPRTGDSATWPLVAVGATLTLAGLALVVTVRRLQRSVAAS